MKTNRFVPAAPALMLASSILTQLASADPLPNAWQITDNATTLGSTFNYTYGLTATQHFAATNITGGFRYAVDARLVTDYGGGKTMNMSYGMGSNRFLIWWDLNAAGDLIAELDGGAPYTITSGGTGSAHYHTHEIIYNPTNRTCTYRVDGQVKTNGWKGSTNAGTAGRISWGAGSSGGKGQMNFNRVTFEITNFVAAFYNAGSNGTPAAPHPTTPGWVEIPGSQTTGTGISPDTALLPQPFTVGATVVGQNRARLDGQVNPSGSPTTAWFNWGTDTNYANMTPVQDAGSNVAPGNVSAEISGLAAGTIYHYQIVASNRFGIKSGSDVLFDLSSFLADVTTLAADQYTTNSARLNGRIGPRNTPTVAWFEWGTSTNYGNATGMQPAGQFGLTNVSAMLTGLVAGMTYHYRAAASNTAGVNLGRDFTFNLLNVFLSAGASLPALRQGSVAWGDYDNDGRLDILLTGYDTNYVPITEVWRNTGSGFSNINAYLTGVANGSAVWGDYDNDGRLDIVLTGYSYLVGGRITELWRNTGAGFEYVNLELPELTDSSAAWGDYDNDGRLDLLLTGDYYDYLVSQVWRNNGNGFTLAFDLVGVAGIHCPWGDYDGDGRLDILLSGYTQDGDLITQVWRNTENGFSNINAGLPGIDEGAVAWGDYDNDGRLDILLAGYDTNYFRITEVWRNTGNGFSNLNADLPGVGGASVAWGDYDNDGRLDIFLAGDDADYFRIAQIWRNTGNGFTNIHAGLAGVDYGSAAWGDSDNDGRLELLLSGYTEEDTLTALLRSQVPASNNAPAAPTGLAISSTQQFILLSWNSATDDHTPVPGLTYNVRIGSSPGASDVLSPMALPNGRRLLAQPGNAQAGLSGLFRANPGQTYYWSVQAVDTAFAASPFSAEKSFTPVIVFAPTNGIPVSGDTNADGVVDQNELNTVLNNYWRNSPPNMGNVVLQGNTVFRFALGNLSGLNFHVLASTNVALPVTNWQDIGLTTLSYQFTDPDAARFPRRFYRIVRP